MMVEVEWFATRTSFVSLLDDKEQVVEARFDTNPLFGLGEHEMDDDVLCNCVMHASINASTKRILREG
jgi:hypothetical protein